ncbi:MAG: SURF1 family cytochrome oxidase biogenesis protein [Nocardioides sp.]
MRSYGFLVSRRWVLFFLLVVLLAYATWLLGQWQFHRLTDRKQSNAVIRTNESGTPTPVERVLAPGRAVADDDQYRLVSATGSYDVAHTVVKRYSTRNGQSGADVVVPLVTSNGTALLVDRGWLATGNTGVQPDDVPAPPASDVTVTGWVRQDATGGSTEVTAQSTRAISSAAIGPALGLQVYGGFVDLKAEDPAPATPLAAAEPPDLGNGPHFFYGLQWWFFGLLAIFGFCYLAYDERRRMLAAPSEGAQHPAVDREHRAGDERRGGAQQERTDPAEL